MADAERSREDVTLDHAHASLLGELDEDRAAEFLKQLAEVPKNIPTVIIEVTTNGGDAELARRLVLEIELARKRLGRRLVFVGKTQVHSAGVTLMSAFPREDRYLSRDATLLIHARQLDTTLNISGPMRSNRAKVEALLHEIDSGLALEEENFERLIRGSDVSIDELREKSLTNWYMTAEEALDRRLVGGLL